MAGAGKKWQRSMWTRASAEDAHRALQEGKLVFPGILFGVLFGLVGNALYGITVAETDQQSRANAVVLVASGFGLILDYVWTLRILNLQRNRRINEPAEGLIVMMRYLPEAKESLIFKSGALKHAFVVVPDPASARQNAQQAVDAFETFLRESDLSHKVELEPVPNSNMSSVVVGAVGSCLGRLRQKGIDPGNVVIDVTDVPGHVLVDLVQSFGDRVQAFQLVPKTMKPELVGRKGHRPSDQDFIPGRPFRFRATEISLEVAPDGE